MTLIERILQESPEEEEIILWTGLDSAFLGIAERFEPLGDGSATHRRYAVYSYARMVEHFVNDGMTDDEAREHIAFNVAGGYVGEHTPAILYEMRDE